VGSARSGFGSPMRPGVSVSPHVKKKMNGRIERKRKEIDYLVRIDIIFSS
jgi:hypothetical protein